jgi:hypothetical protein
MRCGWFYVSCVFLILGWICMLTCDESGWKPTWFDHFNEQSGCKVCDLTAFCSMFDCSGCKPWWLNHCCPPHLQERRCGWFYVRCVFHILTWMCSLWRSLVLEVDVNLYGLTTSNCRVDGRSVTCTAFCIMFGYSGCKPWWLDHCFPPHLKELWCGWLYVRCVLHIPVWMCSLRHSLVLEVDGNLYGLTTPMCRVDGRSVT